MKPFSLIRRVILLVATAALTLSSQAEGTKAAATVQTNAVWHLKITGMHCEGCAGGIRSEVERLPGVATANIILKTGDAFVAVDTNRVSTAKITQAIEEAGYKAAMAK